MTNSNETKFAFLPKRKQFIRDPKKFEFLQTGFLHNRQEMPLDIDPFAAIVLGECRILETLT